MGDPISKEAEAESYLEKSKDYGRQYGGTGSAADINLAVNAIQQAVDLSDRKLPKRLDYIWHLTFRLHQRYDKLKDLLDLEKSIQLTREWLQESSKDHKDMPLTFCMLSSLLAERFKQRSDREDLDDAIAMANKGLSLSSLQPVLQLVYLRTVEEALKLSYKTLPDDRSLDRMIQAQREVMGQSTNTKDTEMWRDMDDLGRGLFMRFERRGNLLDLQEALPLAQQACKLTPPNFPCGSNMFSQMSNVMATSCEAGLLPTSCRVDVIGLLEKAMSWTPPPNDGDRLGLLVWLTSRHREAYMSGMGVAHLYSAIEHGRKSVGLAPEADPKRAMWFHNLATCTEELFEHTGERKLLDEAIEVYRQALSSKLVSQADEAMVANSLSNALSQRYQTSATSQDIGEAVILARRAIKCTSLSHPSRPVYCNTLGNKLSLRYDRFKQHIDLEEAIHWAREAKLSALEQSVDQAMYLSNLSTKLSTKYNVTKDEQLLTEVMFLQKRAVELSQDLPTRRSVYMHNLGLRYYEKYMNEQPKGRREDLEESIRLVKLCMSSTPETHIDWSDYARTVGWITMELLKIPGESDWTQFDECIDFFRSAFNAKGASPLQKIYAGRLAGKSLTIRGRWSEGRDMYKHVLNLLPRLSPRTVTRADMQHRLSGLPEIATFAVVAALNAGDTPEEALAMHEMGRGSISSLLIGSRSDMSLLDLRAPELAQRYRSLGDALSNQYALSDASTDSVRLRQNLMEQLEQLEARIRQLPGFDRFQLPPSSEQLRHLATEGPLVSFNVNKIRSDAFIVTSEKIEVLPLALIFEDDLKAYTQDLVGNKRLTNCDFLRRRANNRRLGCILQWLWTVAVKPVMDYLGFGGGVETKQLPRIWWLTSGLMGLMPLHAAGAEWEITFENTASRATSSYISTFRALAYARERSRDAARQSEKAPEILAVHMPATPEGGWATLNTDGEIRAIARAAKSADLAVRILDRPSSAETLQQMKSSNVVHFACHCDPNADDPSRSALLLWKNEDHADRLTVDTLFDEHHRHVQLAYLSACCTAQQYSMGLIHESIHLGSVFQLMGFPAVVATLWEADDVAATSVATSFYGNLLEPGGKTISSENVARCLHEAMKGLRNQKFGRRGRVSDDLIAWAPFIHIGA